MKRPLREYTVWYQMDGWGTLFQKVEAIDIQDAIKKVIEPIRQKFGDREIFVVKVTES